MPSARQSANPLRDACDLQLGFSLGGERPADRLRAIADYLEADGVEDEIYLTGTLVDRLETYCAKLLGKPAAAWFSSGTQAQLVAALVHAEETGRKTVGLHPTSHLLLHEEMGVEALGKLEPVTVGDWHEVIKPNHIPDNLGSLFIELPHRHNGGLCPDWNTLTDTIDAARSHGIRLHMDGARIWGAREALGGQNYAEICQPFDSVYASFYKDAGALSGAILAGESDFVETAKVWRHRSGGQLVRGWVEMADALRTLPVMIKAMPDWISSAKQLAAEMNHEGLKIEPFPVQTNMFHVRLPVSPGEFIQQRAKIAADTKVWLGGSAWDLDGRDGCSFEISVTRSFSEPERFRIVEAISYFA